MDFSHYLQIIILGIVEGVTEFLPISSTGHLLIAEALMGVHQPDVFNVVIQSGAILAVVFIYWSKIIGLVTSLDKRTSRNYVFKIILAFLVTGVIGIVLTHKFHLKLPETLAPVAWATLIGGFVILGIEYMAKHLYPHENVSWFDAILIGLGQILAGIFPGTSRSGATIMTGLAMGMKRTTATEFSFMLGIPTMFAAGALDMWKYRKELTTGDHQLLIDIALGFVISAVVAFFVVKWLLRFVQSHTFNGFAYYRILLGAGLLIAIYLHPSLAQIGKAETAEIQTTPTDFHKRNVSQRLVPTPTTNVAPVVSEKPVETTNAAPALTPPPDSAPAPLEVPPKPTTD